MANHDDLIRIKNMLGESLLTRTIDSGMVGRGPQLRVANVMDVVSGNVHAVGIGRKITDGVPTDTPCVRVYVAQKIAESMLPAEYRIPSEVDGVPVDVIESPPAVLMNGDGNEQMHGERHDHVRTAAAAGDCSMARKQRQRPVQAGISAAHFQVTAGTIAYFCRSTRPGDDPSAVYALSNNHVFADVNQGRIGDAVYQHSPIDGGTAIDRFADLSRWVPIALGGQTPNRVDAAIARLHNGFPYRDRVCSIGKISGVERAMQDMRVRKHGRTTGYTEGVVTDVSYNPIVGMDHNNPRIVALFKDQIRIERLAPYLAFGLGGDSGSLIVGAGAHDAVGLYFAGPAGGAYGIANPIDDVLAELEIELV
jgi:hypothetical protein